MSVTIKDIAKAAGVSHPTVSRALNDNPAISAKTIKRIKDLANRMGYIPSATARGLKTSRTFALGVITSFIEDPFWSEVLQGVDDILHPAGYSLFIAATHRDVQREKEVVQAMVQRGVDGVILLAPQFSPKQCHTLQTYGLPMAMVNNEGAGECQCLIFNDDIYGIRQITAHLVQLGHSRIAYLGNRDGGLTNRNRQAGFSAEMAVSSLNIPEEYLYQTSGGNPAGGLEGAQYLLGLKLIPTAIVCYNDYMAVGVYNGISGAGLSIPGDVSVTGFDDINMSAFLTPPLTTLRQCKYELGVGAARMMLEMLTTTQNDPCESLPAIRKIKMEGELLIRSSTAPPPSEQTG